MKATRNDVDIAVEAAFQLAQAIPYDQKYRDIELRYRYAQLIGTLQGAYVMNLTPESVLRNIEIITAEWIKADKR